MSHLLRDELKEWTEGRKTKIPEKMREELNGVMKKWEKETQRHFKLSIREFGFEQIEVYSLGDKRCEVYFPLTTSKGGGNTGGTETTNGLPKGKYTELKGIYKNSKSVQRKITILKALQMSKLPVWQDSLIDVDGDNDIYQLPWVCKKCNTSIGKYTCSKNNTIGNDVCQNCGYVCTTVWDNVNVYIDDGNISRVEGGVLHPIAKIRLL